MKKVYVVYTDPYYPGVEGIFDNLDAAIQFARAFEAAGNDDGLEIYEYPVYSAVTDKRQHITDERKFIRYWDLDETSTN